MSSSSSGQSASSSSQPSPPSDATADAFPLNLGAAVTTWTWTGLPPSTDSLFLPPDFSGYEIIRELGRGGMGVVFLARQTRLGRLVAVKMLTAPFLEPRDLQRLRLEAQTLAALRHPHIVQIHDVGEVTGRPFLALEYVAGGTLAERLRGQPLSPHEAARLVATLADAMHAAHAQGIIHRDLKPGNVLLMDADKPDQAPDATSERSDNSELPASRQTARLDERPPATPGQGQLFPKITDFGLAKRLGGSGSQTLSGMIVGTPEYMAPEQAGAHHSDVSPSVDVFALGTILYEMLTGRPPHRGTTLVETLFQVQHLDPLAPRLLAPGTPRDLDTICLKCLEKAPAKRYESAAALRDDLRRFLAGEPIEARPVSQWERTRKWVRRQPALAGLIGLGILTLVILGTAVMLLSQLNLELESAWNAEAQQRQAVEARQREVTAANDYARQVIDDMTSPYATRGMLRQRLRPEQRTFLLRAVEYYQRFSQEATATNADRRRLARACLRLATLQLRLGEAQAAADACGSALGVLSQLPASPDPLLDPRDLMVQVLHVQATAERHLGRRNEARVTAMQTIDLARKLVQAAPNDTDLWLIMGDCLSICGTVTSELGELEEASAAFAEAYQVMKALRAQRPNDAQVQGFLASVCNNYGTHLRLVGQVRRAEAVYREGLALARQATDQSSDEMAYRELLLMLQQNLAVLLHQVGEFAIAATLLEEALAMGERLIAEAPAVVDYRQAHAKSHWWLAGVRFSQGQPEASLRLLQRARQLAEEVRSAQPADVEMAQEYAAILGNLGFVLSELGRLDEAEAALGQALKTQREAVQAHPRVAEYRLALVHSLNNLGGLQERRYQPSAAARCFAEARDLTAQLVSDFPEVGRYAIELAAILCNLGSSQREQGDLDEALKLGRQAVASLESLQGLHERDPMARDYLVLARYRLGQTLLARGEPAEALRQLRQALPLAGPPVALLLRAELATALLAEGQSDAAVAQVREIMAARGLAGGQCWLLAGVLAEASGAAGLARPEAERRAGEAVALLGRAADQGYFANPAHRLLLDEHPRLASLRGRADFRELRGRLP